MIIVTHYVHGLAGEASYLLQAGMYGDMSIDGKRFACASIGLVVARGEEHRISGSPDAVTCPNCLRVMGATLTD